MNELEQRTLINKRASLKSDLTIHENRILTFQIDSPQDHFEVAARFEQLQVIYSKFAEVQAELDLLETESSEKEQFVQRYFILRARCEALLQHSEFDSASTPPRVANGFRGFPSPEMEAPIAQDVLKLPEIKLPVFDGDIKNWQHFRDLVSDLIVNNPNLRDSTKFFHLYSCLSPKVRQCLSSIPQSASNFTIAWETLVRRYDNPRLLVNAHVGELFRPPPHQANSSHSLRALVDHVQANVAALRVLHLSVPIEDLLISHLILNGLDPDTLRSWKQHIAVDCVPSLSALLDFLERRARVLDVSPTVQGLGPSAPVNLAAGVNRNNGSQRRCYLCSQAHTLWHCPRFLALSHSERLRQVAALNLCRSCLRRQGPNHSCPASVCRICGQPHHTLLHRDALPAQNRPPPAALPFCANNGGDGRTHLAQTLPLIYNPSDPRSRPEPGAMVPASAQNTVNSFAATQEDRPTNCLLPTAIATVFDKHDAPVKCRILLDGGSDCHLITKDYADRLGSPPSPCNVNVAGLGSSTLSALGSVKVTLRSRTSSFQTSVECFIVDRITANLPAIQVGELLTRNCVNYPSQIQVLIALARSNSLSGPACFLICSSPIV